MSLAQTLRTETHALHRQVEASGVMSSLLRGQIDRAGYLRLQRNLYTVYEALEPALAQHAQHASLAPLGCARFRRLELLAADLQALGGVAWAQEIAVVPAAADYANHLHRLAAQQPALLAAHAYVRYLGDLSGGQLLRGIVARALGLPGGIGTGFFDFGDAATVAALAASFRSGLDALALVEVSAQDLVHEAQHAFSLHAELFEALGELQR
jgi:heme oxygenase (biliverdin-producing, ferredoxin)